MTGQQPGVRPADPVSLAIVAALREVARRRADRRATLTVVDGGRKAA